MPLAAPLILPFAELAGITIAGLGMAAASKKVSDFISDNPEISTQILTTLVPGGVGLNALFKDKDAPSTKDIVLGELGKEKGNYSSPDAEGAYSSKRGRIIKALEEAGKIKKGPDKDYDSSKKYKDYKKFYEKADGGAIGIEVLFEEKKDGGRIGYQSGGGLMDIETEFGLQAPKGTISFDDYLGSFDDYLGGLYNSDKVGALQNLAVKDYAQGDYTKTATGPISDFRHQAAMNELSKSFSPGLVPNIIGDTIAFGAGLINEIPALGRGVNRENLREIGEDIVSNFKGTYGTSNKRTPEEIYDSIFNPRTTVVSSPNLTYGTAAAADFQDGQILQPNVVPERIAPATYYNSAPNFNADVLREEEDAQYNLPKTNGIINSLLNMKSTVPQMLLSAATKVPGAGLVLGGLSSLSNLIGNSFENRQLTGEGVIVDEFGRSYDADELNAQNALGGYYTDAARSSRRRDSRIQNMLARQAAGKTISQNNLIALQEQAAREQAARETATAALAAQNASTYGTSGATGGYQSSWGGVDSFMSGSGTAADMGSFADGGRVNYQAGGVATPEQYAAALQKVGAGTETQKRTSLGNYLGDYIATQGQKLGNAAVIPFQAAKGVLGIQGTPITDSMQTSLQNIIQNQIKNSGKLSGNINYNDYGVKTNTQGNEFLGFGDRSFTDPEAALATTLGQASYSVDPKTGKITFTGGTAYDFGDDQFGGLGKFISKGGVFNQLPSVSNKFQPGATEYNPDITLGSDFMKQFNQPKYPDYKTAALQSQYYKNNPSNLDSDLFRAAYARALPDSGIKTRITNEGQVATDYGNYDPSRVYSAYMGNTGTSSSNPFFDQFKGSQYADMPTIMEAMYGTPGNINPYYADGGLATMFRKKQ
jgi:hypothetical protein